MPKYPDRKKWDARTGSYMRYPGIPPVEIEVGQSYNIVFVDQVGDEDSPIRRRYLVLREKTFKFGRRWWMLNIGKSEGAFFLYEHDIMEQKRREIIVGAPWNYAKFNPNHSDHMKQTAA